MQQAAGYPTFFDIRSLELSAQSSNFCEIDPVTISSLIRKYLQEQKLAEAVRAAKLALKQCPGAPALRTCFMDLLVANRLGICEALADAHIEKNPNDPFGFYAKAEVFLRGYIDNGGRAHALLGEARDLAERATVLNHNAGWPELDQLKCNIARLMNLDPATISHMYETLLAKYPYFAQAHYNYGLFFLYRQPLNAMEQFERALRIEPNNVEFVIAKVRACILSGQYSLAQSTLNRAKELCSHHPMIHFLSKEIENKSRPPARIEPVRFHS